MDTKNALTFLTDCDISTLMRKAHSHAPCKMMRRSSRVFLNDLNPGKVSLLIAFLQLCHFGLTPRLAQALVKEE